MAAPAGFPLSVQQRRLWALTPTTARNVRVLAIEGELDAGALARALEGLVERHEALRTTFVRAPGLRLPLQVIADQASLDWDARAGEGEPALQAATERLSRGEEFDPSAGPALAARLVALGPERHGLVLAVPGLCADRASMDVIVAQLGQLYGAARQSSDAPEAEPVQYVDFAGWQESLADEEGAADAESFWQAQMAVAQAGVSVAGTSTPLGVPVAEVSGTLDAGVVDRLSDGAADFLAACWHAVLWRMSQPSQMAVGHVFDGRPLDDLGDAVGAYAHPLPVVSRPQPGMPFVELAEQVRQAAAEAGERQGPFGVAGGAGSDELSLPWQLEWRAARIEPGWDGLTVRTVDEREWGHPHELKLVCATTGSGIDLLLTHDPGRVPAEQARQLLDGLIAAAADAAERPRAPIDELALAGPHARREALRRSGGPAPAVQADSFHQAVETQARATPQAPALEFGDVTLTYAELVAAARGVATRLRHEGVEADTCVAICMPRGADYVVALLGAMMAGAAYLPLDADYPAGYLKRILFGADARALVADPTTRERLAGLDVPVLTLPADGDGGAPETELPAVAPDSLAYTIYTSGSTGEPKGVEVTHRSLLSLAAVLSETVYAGRSGPLRVSVNAPFTFDASVKQIAMLAHGHTLHVLPADIRLDSHALSDHIEHRRVDVLDCTPSQLRPLLHAIDLHEGREHPRVVLVGGEAVGTDLWTALRQRPGLDAFNVYGPTETTVDATVARVDASGPEPTIGTALPGVQALVLDPARQPVPPGYLGELCIGGWGVAGYAGGDRGGGDGFVAHPDPDRAGERVFCTGDLVRERADGRLEYVGRRDRQVKLRGFRIGLGEIEAALSRHPAVDETAVVDVTTRAGSRRLCAFVVAVDGDEAQIVDAVRAHAESELPEHMRPASVELSQRLPVTSHGKVDLAALRERALERLEAGGEYVAPRSDPERLLADIWASALEIERVGVNDDFFDLGGDSILQIVVVARAKERGLQLTPRDLFENPTVAELAAVAA